MLTFGIVFSLVVTAGLVLILRREGTPHPRHAHELERQTCRACKTTAPPAGWAEWSLCQSCAAAGRKPTHR